jgi:AcrR family transcriptional regulator
MQVVSPDTNASTGAAPVEKWTPERRRARTRTALVDAARFVFARKGFEGASLDEIADTAGYTRGAIYKHFDGKEELLFAVFDQVNNQALERFSELMELDPSGAIDPSTIVDTWKALFADDADVQTLGLEFRLYELRHPAVHERAAAHRERNRRLILEFMRAHSADGNLEFKVAPETLAAILLITADAFSFQAQIDPDAAQLYQVFLELFLPTVISES